MSPRVLDRNGVELRVGGRVNRPGFQMVGEIWLIDGDGDVFVEWPGQPFGLPCKSRRRFTARPTYRCADLIAQSSEGERPR